MLGLINKKPGRVLTLPGESGLDVDSLRYMLLASFLDAPNPWDFRY